LALPDSSTGPRSPLPEWLRKGADPAAPGPHPAGRLRSSAFRGLRTASRTAAEARLAERLARNAGWLQHAHPVLKLLLALGLIVLASLLHNPLPIFGLWLLALVLAAADRLPIGRLLGRNLPVALFFGALLGAPALFNWLVPGPPLWTIVSIPHPLFHLPPTLTVTRPGLHSWLLLTSRVGASVALALLLIWTTPFDKLLAVLRRLRAPAYLVFLLFVCYRYLLVLLQEMQNLLQARLSRQLGRLSTRTEQRITSSGIGWLYLKSRRLAADLGEAMTSRGFSAQ